MFHRIEKFDLIFSISIFTACVLEVLSIEDSLSTENLPSKLHLKVKF